MGKGFEGFNMVFYGLVVLLFLEVFGVVVVVVVLECFEVVFYYVDGEECFVCCE